MTINKLINDLQVIKQSTNDLRQNLLQGGVNVSNTDTLPTLVSRTPELVTASDYVWKPDPLWKFPDPNGSANLKTIEEIYDEDTLAETYTYRAIHLIGGNNPTIDLRMTPVTTSRIITYILSDGTVYENTTGTSLIHTWDKTKDVTDSKGGVVRYVRVYNNTSGFMQIQRFNSSLSIISGMESNTSASNTNILDGFNELQSIVLPNVSSLNLGIRSFLSDAYSLQNLSLPNLSIFNSSSGGSFLSNAYSLQNLSLPNLSSLSGSFLSDAYSLQNLSLPNLSSLSGIFLSNAYSLQNLSLPNLSSLSGGSFLSNAYSLQNLSLPNLSSLSGRFLSNAYSLQNLSLPNADINSSNFLNNDRSLITLTLKLDFNSEISISSCPSLSVESLVGIFENLKDLTSQSAKVLVIGSDNIAKLTAEQIEIATDKNWTIS